MGSFKQRRSLAAGLMLIIALLAGISIPSLAQATGTDYYVSNSGCLDSNPGTVAQPWCTFAPINARTFSPGDRILLARGSSWQQTLILNGNGTSANPIVVDAYGSGARPRIYGTGKEYERGVKLTDRSHWTIRNLRIDTVGIGILARYTNNGPYQGLKFDQLYLEDIAGIYHRSGSGQTDGAFNSAGIVVSALAPYNGAPTLTDVLMTNIEGTGNQSSILLEGGGIAVTTSITKELKTIDGVLLRNLYLHNDDGRQPASPQLKQAWEFNATGSLNGWGNPFPGGSTSAAQANIMLPGSLGVMRLQSTNSPNGSSIDSPGSLNINPNNYRYLRIGLRNRTTATHASIFFDQGGTYYPVSWPIINNQPDQMIEYMVDLATNPNWAPSPSATVNAFRLHIPAGGSGMDIDYMRIESLGCDESLKVVAAKNVTLSDSRIVQAAACDSLTGTASVFVGNGTDFRMVNTLIKDTPSFAGSTNNDMDGIDFEAYNSRMTVQNSFFAGNKGPGINIITRTGAGCAQNPPDYADQFLISSNLFANNGTQNTPATAAIRDAACNPAASERADGLIKQNLYAEPVGLLSSPATSQLILGTGGTLDQNLSAPNGHTYAADGFSGTQGGNGWTYRARSTALGTLTNLTYDSPSESWGPAASITRFTMRPESTNGAEVVRTWTVPASANGHFVSIRSRPMLTLPINPSEQSVAVRVTLTRSGTVTTLLPAATLSTTVTKELDQLSEIQVQTNDVINFVVANTSSPGTLAPTVSWTPAIAVR